MTQYVPLPDGNSVKVREGETPAQAYERAQTMYPESFGIKKEENKPKEDTKGFKAAAAAGFERLKGETALTAAKLGLKDIDKAEAYQKEKQAAAAKRFTPTQDSFIESPLQNVKELLGSSVPYMVAPAAAGIAALAAPASVAAGVGLLGAGAVSAGQFTGSNLARQMDTGKSLEETSLGTAVAGAIPQALLDTAAMALLPGIGKLFGSVGSKLTTEQAKAIASQTLTRTIADYTAKTGMAMGREGFTEAAQQVIERVQAGLEIDNPEARKEYIDSFIGGAILGGVLAPAGRAFERGGAKRQAAAADRAEALQLSSEQLQKQKAQEDAAAQALETERQSPEYAKSVVAQYDALQKQKQDLIAQKRKIVDASPTADADRAFNAELNQQLRAVAAEIKPLAGEYNRVQPIIQQEAEKARVAGMSPYDYMLEQAQTVSTKKVKAAEPDLGGYYEQQIATPAPKLSLFESANNYVQQRMELARNQLYAPSVDDYVSYLMQDPTMARAAIDTRANMFGLKKDVQKALSKLDETQTAQDRIKAEQADRVRGQMTGAAPGSEIMGAARDRGPGAVPELVALRNIGDKNRAAATSGNAKSYLTETDPQGKLISERLKSAQEALPEGADTIVSNKDEDLVQGLIDTLPKGGMITPGQVFQGLGGGTSRERSDLLTQLAIARESSGKSKTGGIKDNDISRGIIEKLRALKQTETTGTGTETAPMQTVLAGISVPEARAKEAAANKFADQQNQQLLAFTRMLSKVNRGTLVLPETFKQRSDAAKQAYLQLHLDEINARRDAFGLPPMADWERGEARARVMEALNELGDRWGSAANAGPAGQRQFGSQIQAVAALQEQMRSNIQKTVAGAAQRANLNATNEVAEKTTAPAGTGKRIAAPAELTLRGEARTEPSTEDMIEALLSQTETRERAVPTAAVKPVKKVTDLGDIKQLLEKERSGGKLEPMSKGSVQLLEQLQDMLPQTTDADFKELARKIVRQIYTGNEPNLFDVRDLDEMARGMEAAGQSTTRPGVTPEELQRTSAQPQLDLFSDKETQTQRATPRNFQKMLDSGNVQRLRQIIAQLNKDSENEVSAVEETLTDAQAKLAKAEKVTQKALGKVIALEEGADVGNSPLANQSTEALATVKASDEKLKTRSKVAPESSTFVAEYGLKPTNKEDDQIKLAWAEATRDVVAAESALQALPLRIAYLIEIRDSVSELSKKGKQDLIALIDEALRFGKDPSNPASMRDSLEQKEFAELKQWLDPDTANTEIKRLKTLYNLAKKSLDPARERLDAAVAKYEEGSVVRAALEREQKQAQDALDKAQRDEQAARFAVKEEQKQETTTEEVGTPNAEYRATLQRAREGLNLPGVRNLVDTTQVKQTIFNMRSAMGSLDAQLENKNLTEEKRAELQAKRDDAEQKLSTVYQDAPRITSEIKENGQLELERAFDDAQVKAYDKQIAKRRKRKGESAPVLPSSKTGPVAKGVRNQRITQLGETSETTATKEAATALETLAEERAKLADLERREQFLRDNGKAKSKGRLTPMFKALQEQITKQKNVVADAAEEQGKIVAEVRETKQALGKKRIQNVASETEVGLKGDEAKIPKAAKPLFSRGPTTDPSTVNTVNTELKKYFKDLSRIKIYNSVDELVKANPQYKGRIPTDARGFVDTAGNKAFLIAENIDQGQALGVLLHEVGAHVGLKNILGESQYTGMVNAIKGWAKKNDGSVESVVAKAAIARVEAAKTDAKHRDDETLAYAIEEAVKAGVIPNQTKGVLGTWLSRIADGFRKLLTKFGMDLKSFDAQGLVDIAYGAAQMEMRAMPEGMSRRTFLRGAVSAVGQMYLPAVNTGLSINAKAKLFEATLDAADAWFSTVVGMAKTPALRNLLKDYSFDIDNEAFSEALYNVDSDVEGVESLYSHMFMRSYGNGDETEGLIDLLKSKPDSVEKLQMAILDMRSQLVAAIEKLPKKENGEIAEDKLPAVGDLLFSRKAAAEPDNALIALSRQITAQPKTLKEKLSNNLALQAEMQAVDMRAGLRKTLKFGDDSLFMQAMYHVRKAEQKMAQMFTVMNSGPLVAYKDSKGFVGYRSSNENSARDVFDAIADVPVADPQLKTNITQAYMVAQRTANKGLPKLDLGELGITEEQLTAALAAADADPALKKALENVRTKYNAYNRGMIEFLASTGRISKKVAADLLKEGDYVPFYRVDKNGNASLVFNNNVTFNVGDIRRQPYLAELKGGDTKLLPLNEALQRNTLLLTDMALTNNAAKSVAYGLQALGKGKGPVNPKTGKPTDLMAIKIGLGDANAKVIRFYQEPDPNKPDDKGERHIEVDTRGTAAEGIPAELVVQSLEGASLALPGFFKLGGAAADLLRTGVTRTPLYIARKLLREPMAASFTGGLEENVFSSVFSAGAEFLRMSTGNSAMQAKLIEKGLIQSNIFAGDMSDMKKMALQLASGKDQSALDKVIAAADRYAMRADAATLALVLRNAEANGLSEVEADMATMESMNFYKRGLSPTLQYASRLIPFFNAQIQGLNVLYKAARGQMPFEEQQQIKRKFFNNAMLLMATGIVYAMAMDDDETFRNARPRDKYANFFLPIPGVDEPLKLPIPFEAGYFFSLAVAAVDGMRAETDGKAQFQALRDLFLGSIPGYSSMGVPALVKPVFEVWTDKNFLTGGPVEPRRMQGYDTEERYLATTTELAKQMSKLLPILSPIQIEHIVRGYLGVLPLVAAAGANGLFEREGKGEKPAGRASDLPLIGTAFQKKYGGGDADVVYREAQEAIEARGTFKKMLSEGRREEAVAYRDKNKVEMAMAPAAGQYRQIIGRINTDIRRTQERDDLTAEEKRLRLDALDKAKQDRADAFIRQTRAVEERLGG